MTGQQPTPSNSSEVQKSSISLPSFNSIFGALPPPLPQHAGQPKPTGNSPTTHQMNYNIEDNQSDNEDDTSMEDTLTGVPGPAAESGRLTQLKTPLRGRALIAQMEQQSAELNMYTGSVQAQIEQDLAAFKSINIPAPIQREGRKETAKAVLGLSRYSSTPIQPQVTPLQAAPGLAVVFNPVNAAAPVRALAVLQPQAPGPIQPQPQAVPAPARNFTVPAGITHFSRHPDTGPVRDWEQLPADRILQMIGLQRNVFPRVEVDGKMAQPLFTATRTPSAASAIYTLIAAAGPLEMRTIYRLLQAFFNVCKVFPQEQTLRRAVSQTNCFYPTTDDTAWRLGNVGEVEREKKPGGKGGNMKRKKPGGNENNDDKPSPAKREKKTTKTVKNNTVGTQVNAPTQSPNAAGKSASDNNNNAATESGATQSLKICLYVASKDKNNTGALAKSTNDNDTNMTKPLNTLTTKPKAKHFAQLYSKFPKFKTKKAAYSALEKSFQDDVKFPFWGQLYMDMAGKERKRKT